MSTVARIVPRGMPRAVLAGHEDVVPEARLEVGLELGQVVVRAQAGPASRSSAARPPWKRYSPKSNRLAQTGRAVDQHVPLDEVPAARPDQQRGGLRRPARSACPPGW